MKNLAGAKRGERERKKMYNDAESRERWKLSNDSNSSGLPFFYIKGAPISSFPGRCNFEFSSKSYNGERRARGRAAIGIGAFHCIKNR